MAAEIPNVTPDVLVHNSTSFKEYTVFCVFFLIRLAIIIYTYILNDNGRISATVISQLLPGQKLK